MVCIVVQVCGMFSLTDDLFRVAKVYPLDIGLKLGVDHAFGPQAKLESHHLVERQAQRASRSRALPRPAFSSPLVVCIVF